MKISRLTAENAYLTEMLRQAGLEVQAQRVAAELQAVLTGEIHHRMKNMLAMVAAIVRQSMRSASSIAGAEAAISTRLIAMSKAHDLLLNVDLKAASSAKVIRAATEQHDPLGERISLQGAEVEIMPSAILPMTLILNELCTNATKYGALSNTGGKVQLDWLLDTDDNILVVNWAEKDGPPVNVPRIKSLGSRLIEDAIPQQLGGTGRLAFPKSGVEFELSVPYAAIKPQALTLGPNVT